MKNKESLAKTAIALSLVAVVLAAIDTLTGADILGLAGTQWILIGIVLAVYAIFLGTCDCDCGCGMDKKE